MLIEKLQDVPKAVIDKALVGQPVGWYAVRISLPVYPGAKTVYSYDCEEYRTVIDNVRGAFMGLSNDLYHIGIVDIDIADVKFAFYTSSGQNSKYPGGVIPQVKWTGNHD